tara:strand:- start:118 stop:543 length:426 start_codon:yes stop_codon:yes gene_type:complete
MYSCAKPKVTEVILPGDNNLTCKEIKNELSEVQKIKREAEYVKGGTGGNIARMTLFWPAWARTLHNADVAIVAANERIYHLFKIMKKKKCKDTDAIKDQIEGAFTSSNTTPGQLRELNEMYESGILTEEEFKLAKEKILLK